jgi:hypothetical protein
VQLAVLGAADHSPEVASRRADGLALGGDHCNRGGGLVSSHPGEDYRLDTAVIDLHDDREIYLVSSDLRGELFSEIKLVRLYTTISRQNVVAIWPCKLPGVDGRSNSWYDTALRAAELAMTRWTRIVADMSLGGYQPYIAAGDLPDPEWPEQTFAELLKIAFLKRAVVTTEAPAGPILLSLYADCGSQQGLKLSPRVVAVARKPNDETNEV